ncbi:MAG: hypothetical protein P8H31_05990, partial [Porticoccaceae bacterium]|nr:hypothetical protein [Porticoccaceae bacterium]
MLADLLPLISLMVAGLGTLVAILVLAAPSKNRLAAYVLAVFILVQSLANLYQYFLSDHSAISQQLSFYLQLSVLLAYFITGPLLYAYTRLMTSAGFVLRAWHFKHILFAAITIITFMSWQYTASYFGLVVIVLLFGYNLSALKHLAIYKGSTEQNKLTLDPLSLSWLYRIVTYNLVSSVVIFILLVLLSMGI